MVRPPHEPQELAAKFAVKFLKMTPIPRDQVGKCPPELVGLVDIRLAAKVAGHVKPRRNWCKVFRSGAFSSIVKLHLDEDFLSRLPFLAAQRFDPFAWTIT